MPKTIQTFCIARLDDRAKPMQIFYREPDGSEGIYCQLAWNASRILSREALKRRFEAMQAEDGLDVLWEN